MRESGVFYWANARIAKKSGESGERQLRGELFLHVVCASRTMVCFAPSYFPVKVQKKTPRQQNGKGKFLQKTYFLLKSFGVTQVPVALATTIGSSKKSAAEALMSFLETITFLASKVIFLEVFPILVISP